MSYDVVSGLSMCSSTLKATELLGFQREMIQHAVNAPIKSKPNMGAARDSHYSKDIMGRNDEGAERLRTAENMRESIETQQQRESMMS